MICGVSCLPAGAMCETLVDPKGSRCPTRGVSFLAYRKANPSFSSSPLPPAGRFIFLVHPTPRLSILAFQLAFLN